jgi:hypothetical protein
MTLLELCPNAADSSNLWCRNTCRHILQKWKPPYQLPPLSTPIPDLNGMLATVLKCGGGGGGGGRGAVNDVTHSNMPTPIPSPPLPFHMQLDGNNFASTACPSSTFNYLDVLLTWTLLAMTLRTKPYGPPTPDAIHWFSVLVKNCNRNNVSTYANEITYI